MFCIIFNYSIKKKLNSISKIGYVVLFICSYICFINSASRGGWLAAGFGLLLYLLLMRNQIFFRVKKNGQKVIVSLFVSVTVFFLSVFIFYSSYLLFSHYDTAMKIREDNKTVSETISKQAPVTKSIQYSRNLQSQAKNDISNGRFDIWKIYLRGFEGSFLFGVGHNNKEAIYKYFAACYPEDPLVHKNNFMQEISTPHNIILMLLGYYGIGGTVLFISFLIFAARKMYLLYKQNTETDKKIYALLISYWGMILLEALVGNLLIEYFICINVVAWNYLGYGLGGDN